MEKKVLKYLRKWNMISPGQQVLVGFSGGADSTALLELLYRSRDEFGITVRAVHVNHGIRGAEAMRDQMFCEAFCRERKIPLDTEYADVPALAKEKSIGTEEAGREVRYRIFETYIKEGLADRVALAHHQNDQAETMLFRLMRGTGLKGLRGMEPVRGVYVRPLLCAARTEIENWLKEEGIPWIEDGSNQELLYARNQIRHQILPVMESMRPGAAVHMAQTAEQLLEIEDYLKQQVDCAWKRYVFVQEHGYTVLLEAFDELHKAILQPLLLRVLSQTSGKENVARRIYAEQLAGLARGKRGSRIIFPCNVCAVLEYEAIVVKQGYGNADDEDSVPCEIPGCVNFKGQQFCFLVEELEKNEEIPANRYTKWFDYDKIKNNVFLRTRRPGDYLANAEGSHKKLKDYLIDCKIPREERDQCILLADGSHIIWAVGMRISADYKVTEETRRVLKVQKVEQGGNENEKASC